MTLFSLLIELSRKIDLQVSEIDQTTVLKLKLQIPWCTISDWKLD